MALELPEELPEGYYLENFEYLLGFVADRHGHLLSNSEQALIDRFFSAGEYARKLYVRMANRKGEFFRRDKLDYPEIPDIDVAMQELYSLGLAVLTVPELEASIALCRKDELLALDVATDCRKSIRRDELAILVLEAEVNPIQALGIEVVQVTGMEALLVLRLLFFGNFHQDMTEFVLHELVSPFESYPLTRETSLFTSRDVVEDQLRLRALSELSHDIIASDDSGDALLELVELLGDRPSESTSARRYDRIVNRVARQLERLDRKQEAHDAYRLTVETPARERRARILAAQEKAPEAVRLCQEILKSPRDEEEWEFAASFGSRLIRKHKLDMALSIDDAPDKVEQSLITVPRLHDKVELSALAWYLDQGLEGWYVENSLFRALFGLCFWDVIFAPVPGVFFHPFQRGPDDLYTREFAGKRRALIDDRLREVQETYRIRQLVSETFKNKEGIANHFVGWQWLDTDLIATAIDRIPGHHLALIFQRMLDDLKNNTSGLPDLIIFDEKSYRLIEIKGPGDKLQKNQARWFRYFDKHDIPAEVVDVNYCE